MIDNDPPSTGRITEFRDREAGHSLQRKFLCLRTLRTAVAAVPCRCGGARLSDGSAGEVAVGAPELD